MKRKDGFKGERSLVLPKIITDMIADDAVASQLYITDIGFYPRAAGHYRKRKTPIGQNVLIYCTDGAGWVEAAGRTKPVAAGQYVIIPAGMEHSYGADECRPWTIYWIHFAGALAAEFVPREVEPQAVAPGLKSRISQRNALFEEIFRVLSGSFSMDAVRYAMSAFHHYLASLRFLREYREGASAAISDDIIEATIHYLGENVERHLTLNEIADFVGYSASHLSAVFKQRTGHSPMNYFNLLKVRAACEMLDATSMKLNQISLKLGIEDQFYFSRLFSRIMGMSPSAYRTRVKP